MNGMKTAFLMALMMIIMIIVGDFLGGQSGMMIAFIISLALNFGSYWFSDKIVLAMYKAKRVEQNDNPDLFNLVERLSSSAGLPMPKVYIIDNATPNAFATGRNPANGAVAVTTGILRILSMEELSGVLAHELAHIKNRDILIGTIAAAFAGTITFIARMAGWAAMFGGNRDDDRDSSPIVSLVLMIVAPIAAMLIQMAISRSREYAADSGGASISGNALSLASALKKLSLSNERIPMTDAGPATAHMFIVNPLSGGMIKSLFSTHPPMEERIKRLEEIAAGRRI
ncbi:MAG: zinc metalloprotease HtpX [Ignavibacteria bacterium]|nr:zinc metalloprotease HtpX [Ignavibacteria bacterium]